MSSPSSPIEGRRWTLYLDAEGNRVAYGMHIGEPVEVMPVEEHREIRDALLERVERGQKAEAALSTQPNPIGDREQLHWIASEALNVLEFSLKPGAGRETVDRKLAELRAALAATKKGGDS